MTATGPSYGNGGLSAAATAALALKANVASPTLTGVPAAPTAAAATNTTQIATTAFVTAAISAAIPATTHRYQPPKVWYRLLVAISLTDDPLATRGAGFSSWTAPRAGSVVGITARLDGDVEAGTLTVISTINGSDAANAIVVCTAEENSGGGTTVVAAGLTPYAAGGTLGVSVTTTIGLLPAATLNLEVYIEVEEAS